MNIINTGNIGSTLIVNGKVIVRDGEFVGDTNLQVSFNKIGNIINVSINGDVESVECGGNVTVNCNASKVSAGCDATVGDVSGNVSAGGNVKCDTFKGRKISAGGTVSIKQSNGGIIL